MPLPADLSTGTLTGGPYVNAEGEILSGVVTVTARPSRLVSAATGAVVLNGPVSVFLDENGEFSVELPATDDPDISPTGFTYQVAEYIEGGSTFEIELPAGSTVDVASVSEIDPVSGASVTRGLSAYEIAVGQGFVGTEAEWLDSLHADTVEVQSLIDTAIGGLVGAIATKEDAGTAAARTGGGLLADRPSAASLTPGARYFAEDDGADGTDHVVDTSYAWVQAAPPVASVGGVLASANPAAIAAVAVNNNAVRVPELTTASFVWPSSGTIVARLTDLVVTGAGSDTDRTIVQVRWTKNAWSTSTIVWAKTCVGGSAPFYLESAAGGTVLLSPAGVTPPNAGDTVQVGVFVSRVDTYNMTVQKNTAAPLNPGLIVEVIPDA